MADEIGSRLREARMHAKIDINEVETRTKIRAKYLRAMENEEWDLLPGEVYVKSFLRTYGDFLGLDSRQLLDDFRRRYERPADHELRPIAPLGRERDRQPRRGGRVGVPPWAIIGVVLVIVVAALWFVGKQNSSSPTSTTSTQAHTGTTHRTRHHRRKQSPRVSTRPTTVKLQLQATGTVYVCLVNGTGKKLIPGQIFSTGQTIPTFRASKLLLTLGNNSVKMKVNGSPVSIPASSGSIGYRLLPSGHSPLSASQQPQCA
ncbi:MAG: helix-turn-helix domain-containing protein [Solirubrobacteraceae bacterium]